ncbi:MAG: DegV family protein [Bacilli bacterium]|nr:DegV family protein [Bacilli bacterium]MDD4388583.1 DegV family protein [Bacilli bacterium]
MNKIKIITDYTADLTPEIYKRFDIDAIPLYLTIAGKTYKDHVDITSQELYRLVDEFKELPRTSAVNPVVFIEIFNKWLDLGYQVLYMGLGSGFSATYQTARLVASEYSPNQVRVIDSQNLSSGVGLLVLKAAKFRDQGDDLDTIVRKVKALIPLVRTQFSINTLSYLHKGGRCSGTARIFGTLLKVKPIIRVIDGEMVVAKKPRGKYQVALQVLLDYLNHDKDNVDPDNIMITHSLADEDVVFLRQEIKKIVKVDNILETKASAVISAHCGPRTIGILYILKEKKA